jgi:hemerythrin-like domain-containing protein
MPVPLGIITEHGFDEPIGLLGDCHRRIEAFLGALQKVQQQAGSGPLSEQHRKAVEASLNYFRTAGPRHNEDEENSLFPLLRQSSDPRVHEALAAMDALEAEHRTASASHQRVETLYVQWIEVGSLADVQRQTLAKLLDELVALYQRHIDLEDHVIFPLAAEVLNPEQLEKVGKEMAGRRGIDIKRQKQFQEGKSPNDML